MVQAVLIRRDTGDQGTFGDFHLLDGRFRCKTVELPWRENARGVSCIPAGIYLFKWRTDSPAHGECYEEWDDPETAKKEDVPERDCVQIHAANLAGDAAKGYVAQLRGCIAPGLAFAMFPAGTIKGQKTPQKGVTQSGKALEALINETKKELLELEIVWAPGGEPK